MFEPTAKEIDPEKFALAVVQSSDPDLDVSEKYDLYVEALAYAKKRKTLNAR